MTAPDHGPRFCSACGAGLDRREVEGRLRHACPACGRVHYRNARPAVAVLITRDGPAGREVLLAKRARPPFAGWWDIPGGFLEVDELPEAAVHREIREETGVDLAGVRFLGFALDVYRPDGDPEDLVLSCVYEATVRSGTPTAADDVAELAWFPLAALPDRIAWDWERPALEAFRDGRPLPGV